MPYLSIQLKNEPQDAMGGWMSWTEVELGVLQHTLLENDRIGIVNVYFYLGLVSATFHLFDAVFVHVHVHTLVLLPKLVVSVPMVTGIAYIPSVKQAAAEFLVKLYFDIVVDLHFREKKRDKILRKI